MYNSDIHIFFTVNSGLYLKYRDFSCLIDGLHAGKTEGFSDFPDSLSRELHSGTGIFAGLNTLLFTHLHPDHFDNHLLELGRTLPSRPGIFCPDAALCTLPYSQISNGIYQTELDKEVVFYSVKTRHDGEKYRNVEHVSYLLRIAGETFFIAGDAEFAEADAQIFLEISQQISAAFVNIYHISSPKRRRFLKILSPESIFLFHLPFPEDDINGIYPIAQRLLGHLKADFPKTTILTPMSWVRS